MKDRVVIIGAGAFGTALAAVAAASGQSDVTLLTRTQDHFEDLAATGRNERFLPDVNLPSSLGFALDPTVLTGARFVLFAMPSQAQRAAARNFKPYLDKDAAIICCAKGIDTQSGTLLSDILEAELPGHPVMMLSGPGFAADIARGLPTAMVIACRDLVRAEQAAHILSSRTFRLYPSADTIGVQLGGALKNVMAIAAGMTEGAGLGESARAALIARGLAEMGRLVMAMGGQADTVSGLSGLGDLVLTATSRQSRNYRYGLAIGQTGSVPSNSGELVEGAHAAAIAAKLAKTHGIDMPVTFAVAAILSGRLDVPSAMAELMSRPITTE